MTLHMTLAVLVAGAVLSALSLWRRRRPREIGSLAFPSTLVLSIGLILVILAAGHLVTLGTGDVFTGRMQP